MTGTDSVSDAPVARGLGLIGSARWVGALVAVASWAAAADENATFLPRGSSTGAAPAATGTGPANLITLLVALVLAAVGAWLFWKNRQRTGASRDSRLLAVEETKSLGNRQYLVVASYEGRKFLLGVCPGRIDLLSKLGDDGEELGA